MVENSNNSKNSLEKSLSINSNIINNFHESGNENKLLPRNMINEESKNSENKSHDEKIINPTNINEKNKNIEDGINKELLGEGGRTKNKNCKKRNE